MRAGIDEINSLTDRICSTGGTLILISDDAGVIDTDIRRKRHFQFLFQSPRTGKEIQFYFLKAFEVKKEIIKV